MGTPSQAQLVEERDALEAEIEGDKELYQEFIAKGKTGSANELLGVINKKQGTLNTLSNNIQNYPAFEAQRKADDAAIKETENFETKSNPANQTIQTQTRVTETVTGGGESTVKGPDLTLSQDQANAAKLADQRANAFSANPNSRFSKGTIDKAEASGAISKEEADKLRAGEISEDERLKIATDTRREYNNSVGSESAATASDKPGNPLTPPPAATDPVANGQKDVAQEDPAPPAATRSLANRQKDVAQEDPAPAPAPVAPNPNQTPKPVDGEPYATAAQPEAGPPPSTDPQAVNDPIAPPPQPAAGPPPSTDPQAVNDPIAYTPQDPDNINARQEPQPVTAVDDGTTEGIQGAIDQTRPQQTIAVARNTKQKDDWRISLSLAPGAKYLYNNAKPGDILYPLRATDGIIFPYTPTIQTAYRANYDSSADLIHSNYRLHFYKNSHVDDVQLTADFTAQDTTEANYLLAVIHFLRSATKMFYGQDGNNGPKAGTPPPLCYLNGYGQYQFNEHPVVISSFNYSLPNDVDYLRAGGNTVVPGTNTDTYINKVNEKGSDLMSILRKAGNNLTQGGMSKEPKWQSYSSAEATYVPTKMQIQLTLLPVVTRNDISKNFSLEKYATGELLLGRKRMSGGGIW